MEDTTFGASIKARRKALGLGVTQVAARAGISWSYLYDLESGKRSSPTWERAIRLANALGLDPETLTPVRGFEVVRAEYESQFAAA